MEFVPDVVILDIRILKPCMGYAIPTIVKILKNLIVNHVGKGMVGIIKVKGSVWPISVNCSTLMEPARNVNNHIA